MSTHARVVLISIDGLRPDGLAAADTPHLDALAARGVAGHSVRSVMPSVTLPCHMSMFHSVEPGRHGVTTNTWTPQVRPVPGLFDLAAAAGRRCAMFYNWEQLRDLGRPGALEQAFFHRHCYAPGGDVSVAERAAAALRDDPCDLTFVYLGYVDVAGHDAGWMSPPYLAAVANADACVGRLVAALDGASATLIVTSDHGGHDRTHGTDCDEDMTVPLLAAGPGIAAGGRLEQGSILDIAPTVAALLGLEPPRDWAGRRLSQVVGVAAA